MILTHSSLSVLFIVLSSALKCEFRLFLENWWSNILNTLRRRSSFWDFSSINDFSLTSCTIACELGPSIDKQYGLTSGILPVVIISSWSSPSWALISSTNLGLSLFAAICSRSLSLFFSLISSKSWVLTPRIGSRIDFCMFL